ncbi:MAG: response regulator [Anaerolineae bacterium]|nr:response regulator [Anaerolineae bacterium]
MTFNQNGRILKNNLASLQQESLTAIAVLAILIGYVWLWFDIWPVTGAHAPLASWLGAALLIVCGISSYQYRIMYLHFVSHLLVLCILAATTCATLTFHVPSIIYLFLLPVIFASVLLSVRSAAFIALFASGIMTVVNLAGRESVMFGDIFLPISIILMVAFALWLSAHNLHTTLIWFSDAYEDAYKNEQLARTREAELRRLFKALDDATFRMERLNYALTLERNQAREAHRIKQQFAQTISHELRTPLNLIVAFTELMVQSPDYYGAPLPMPYVRDLSIVHRNAQHLQNLVNDVLDLARIEAAQMTIIPELSDPASLVNEAVTTARGLVERRGLDLQLEIQPDLPKIWVDATRIRQVLFNLLSNAVRFTDVGSVIISVRREEKEIVFAVTDTGIGIAEEDMPRLFKDFQQLDGTTRRQHGGAGLGLAISRRFVELHQGRISVESEPGIGSTFTFTLPITEQQPTSVSGKYNWKMFNDQPIQTPMNHSILLAVTRNPTAIEGLVRHTQDCRTVVASTLQQAQNMAQRLLPQCVVVDTAFEAVDSNHLQALAEAWDMPQIPFIAFHLPDHSPSSQPLNVNGYLTKPFSIQKMHETLNEFAEQPRRILVIDDDQDFVRLLSRMLDTPRYRCQVIGAYNGHDGLALLQSVQPDLVLVDVRLAGWDGTQLVNAIRTCQQGQNTPVIAIVSEDETVLVDVINEPLLVTKSAGLEVHKVSHLIRYFMGLTA